MTVPCDRASTTMLDVLAGAMQVPEAAQSCEGGQPPQVPPQPSSPHVFAVQFDLQFGAGPPSEVPPDAPSCVPAAPLEEPPDEALAPSSPPAATSRPPEEPPSPAA